VNAFGFDALAAHEDAILHYATEQLSAIEGVKIIGTAAHKAGVVSFSMHSADGTLIHPHDVGTLLDTYGIAIRTGHHCTQPLIERFGVPALNRASFALYTSREEIDALVRGMKKVQTMFA
jgi:cysteine desulfurase / selenocysteine lyase